MELWWRCPKCGNKVDFQKQLWECFEQDGEAAFSVENKEVSLLQRISCVNCDASWMVFIGGMEEE